MARAWIELDGDVAGWAPSRLLVVDLTEDGYAAAVWISPAGKSVIVAGDGMSTDQLRAIGPPP